MDENLVYEFTRSISKTGGLGLVSEEAVQWAQQLPEADQVTLYARIRDESDRMESEWRDSFIASTGFTADALSEPEEQPEDDIITKFINWALSYEDRVSVFASFEDLLEQAGPEQLQKAQQLVIASGQKDLLEILYEYIDAPEEG